MGRRKAGKPREAAPDTPLDDVPSAPSTLRTYGREYWERIAPLLVRLRVLTPLHLESLESLCDWWHQYQSLKLHLLERPEEETFTTDSGYEQRSPKAIARDKAFENLTKLWPKFGLTPDALRKLNRIAGSSGKKKNGVAEFAAEKYAEQ